MPPIPHRATIRRRLLTWFHKNARPLPWRANRDPYRVWISEVMLQQTQVVTVIPYFERFVTQFPTLAALAQADEQAVLRSWEGLGYYRRARDLVRAARLLGENNYSTIPDDPAFVGALPGFGRYTTNAVLSQAYERRLPILEANSVRVLCRLFGIERNPKESAVQKELWQLAAELLPARSPGEFNQAMMELGALVCTARQPNCPVCPLQKACQAFAGDRQDELPLRSKPVKIEQVQEVAVIVRKRDRVLIVKRPPGGRWANMWEFPHHACAETESRQEASVRLLAALGLFGQLATEIAAIHHSVTRFRITMICLLVELRHGKIDLTSYPNFAWVGLEDLNEYPLSSPQRRLARILLEKERDGASHKEQARAVKRRES